MKQLKYEVLAALILVLAACGQLTPDTDISTLSDANASFADGTTAATVVVDGCAAGDISEVLVNFHITGARRYTDATFKVDQTYQYDANTGEWLRSNSKTITVFHSEENLNETHPVTLSFQTINGNADESDNDPLQIEGYDLNNTRVVIPSTGGGSLSLRTPVTVNVEFLECEANDNPFGEDPDLDLLAPVGRNNAFKIRSTVPLKFEMPYYADGSDADDLAGLLTLKVYKVNGNPEDNNVSENITDTASTSWRFDADAEQYIFNLGTRNFNEGTYQAVIFYDDTEIVVAQGMFVLRK